MNDINLDVMGLAVEKALLEMGPVELEMVVSKLKKDFQKSIKDCLETPIFLKLVLCELFGNSYKDILKSIDSSFKQITLDDELANFITVLKS